MVEVLIVLAILTLVAGAAGYNVLKMRQQQQFQAGTVRVEQKLQAALETMLIHHNNVRVVFDGEGKKLKVTAETETPLERGIAKLLVANPVIEGVSRSVWEPYGGQRPSGKPILFFSAASGAIPKGTLYLLGRDASDRKSIVLKGYPHPIKVTDDEVYEPGEEFASEDMYPKEVRQLWRSEIKQ